MRVIECNNNFLTSLASQPYFSPCAHARAKVGGGREGNIRMFPSLPPPTFARACAHGKKYGWLARLLLDIDNIKISLEAQSNNDSLIYDITRADPGLTVGPGGAKVM